MAEHKVETISRLAQWRIDNVGPGSYIISKPFKLGNWNWYFSIEKNRYLYIHLFPDQSRSSKEPPPFARFVLRILSSANGRQPYISSPVYERQLRTKDDFVWPVDSGFKGPLVISVEFLDLKGGEATPVWPTGGLMQSLSTQSCLKCLSRMLEEGIHADVTINTAEGSLKAHKAILSAYSPVFQSMFSHDLKETVSSTIDIEDMSLESCTALVSYLYGTIKQEDFWMHRLALLGAANKYDISELKDACEESLMEDINSGNVLERLQEAGLYQLPKLKKGCLLYLFGFGKIFDVRHEMDGFFKYADRELMTEMFQEVLTSWKPA
ncbi:BTB/POZ domain-containing protein At1g21780 isoform X2 [Argentina anserina]|uniref:BTB/POZ domain-containing protein At1g21780 isoform X2 n=1 Tax=Argentina anserina TaxID=57926 RepID=UPI002176297E|nr:BTB/POZ domain-containing protein At1g21780 isoform X2 [Potentilla anserina]